MRSVSAAISHLVIGIALAVPGILLALWVWTALYDVEGAMAWVLWAAAHSPLPLTASPLSMANGAIQVNSLFAAGLLASLLCWAALNRLLSARRFLNPADASHDGSAPISLTGDPPRVGRTLEGSLRLSKRPKPGEVFRVELSSRRRSYSLGEEKTESEVTIFSARQDVEAVAGAEGWSLPFRFDVPLTARASDSGDQWGIAFYPATAWIVFPSRIAVTLAPAPADELRALEAAESPAQKEAIGAIAEDAGRDLDPHERARYRALSPEDLAKTREYSRKVSGMRARGEPWIIPSMLIVFFVIPVVLMAVVFVAGAIFILMTAP